ncbi:TPA: AEC family transporter [Klebsiella pneumoniae]
MTQNNILLISGAILPVIITVIIGYISGKRKDFNWQQAGDINKIVMLYALPLSIFSNMVMTPRHIVMTMGPVAVAIILALILSFVIPLLVIPQTISMSLGLLGKASGGLALFAAGIVLYTRSIVITTATIITVIARNILVPGACYLILLKMGFSMEQIKEVVLTMAIPVGSIAIIIAMQYKTGEQEMASTMALSIIASIITMGGFIFLTF